jgi:primase-polymerase (primpol)-like protein
MAFYGDGRSDGIGFVFTADDPFVGVDLDDCRDPDTKEIEAWADEIVAELSSYTEVSPSGTGFKVFLRGRLPGGGNRKDKVELYDRGRYFAVTGHQEAGTVESSPQERQVELNELHARLFDKPDSGTQIPSPASSGAADLSDDEIIRRAKGAANGAKFDALWAGDISAYPSQSEADLALLSLLAFWTGPDPDRMDRLFRQSGLHRPKWEEREDYRRGQIDTALKGRKEFYTPSSSASAAFRKSLTSLNRRKSFSFNQLQWRGTYEMLH